ncbi:MAG: ABC transporter permease, partial [Vulcanimicrobiaceae bacterium]
MRAGASLPRLLLVVPQLFGVIIVIFFLTHIIPGDPIVALVGNYPAPPDYIAHLRHDLGLDQPLWVQFVDYLGQVVRGNLGYSFAYSAPVTAVIGARIGPTLLLAGSALVLGSLGGVVLGTGAAMRHLGLPDRAVSIVALLGFAVPGFWLSQILILIFAVHLGWLPSIGMSALHSQP